MAEWYKDWFASEEYLTVYSHRNDEDARKLFNLILIKCGIKPPATVLDIACGAGRHSFLFAAEGFKVTAFDLSKTLLGYARKKSAELNLSVDFLCSDVRTLELSSQFDLIINLFTSFGYFNSDQENFLIFDKVKKLLNKNGMFVFDYFNSEYIRRNIVACTTDSLNGKTMIQKRSIKGDRVVKEITINDSENESMFFESVSLYNKEQILKELHSRDFDVTGIYGDYSGNQFDPLTSPRLIIFARMNSN